jgi:hypothetical protein
MQSSILSRHEKGVAAKDFSVIHVPAKCTFRVNIRNLEENSPLVKRKWVLFLVFFFLIPYFKWELMKYSFSYPVSSNKCGTCQSS